MPDLPKDLLGHPTYEVLKELGRGGMGVVYLARHKIIGRNEVLKVVGERFASSPEFGERFLREVKAIGSLQHPNIVIAYGAFMVGKSLVLAMEHVIGHSLQTIVNRNGRLSMRNACDFARQVARGLQKAHERGLVHRDIKPDNLMVTPRGEVKILDFGLAKAVSERPVAALTQLGAMLGTPDYMPPEQSLDARTADIRADVYSLGCTLYCMLVGRPPFSGRTARELMHAHDVLPAPMPAGMPPELANLLTRMLAKRPADRPASPKEVESSLDLVLAALPEPARPAPDLGQTTQDTSPHAALRTPGPDRHDAAGRAGPDPTPLKRGGATRWLRHLGLLLVLVLLAGAASFLWPWFRGSTNGPTNAVDKSITNSIGMRFAPIPAGKFMRGATKNVDKEADEDEGPRREIGISAFHMSVHEVTQAQFKRVMGYNPSFMSRDGTQADLEYIDAPAGGADQVEGLDTSAFPVENVNHDEAKEFCRKLTALPEEAASGRAYRLPTEAEWEYASRGQDKTYRKFGSTGDELTPEGANIGEGNIRRPTKVGSFPANRFGLHDMHGNVWEFCADWWGHYPAGGEVEDPRGPASGPGRVIRGGSCTARLQDCRASSRYSRRSAERNSRTGFRVALHLAP